MTARFALLACAAVVSACSTAPRSGPLVEDIRREAVEPADLSFALIDVTADVAARLRRVDRAGDLSAMAGDKPYRGQTIRSGDRVQVSLFEATGGGLFGGTPEGGAGVRVLPPQTVSPGGRVRIPYGGNVRVSGHSPAGAAKRIEAALEGQGDRAPGGGERRRLARRGCDGAWRRGRAGWCGTADRHG